MNLFLEILPGRTGSEQGSTHSLILSLQGSCFKTDLTCKDPRETAACDARGAIFPIWPYLVFA
jgi:hypothetical protein